MKRMIVAVIAMALVLALAGCGAPKLADVYTKDAVTTRAKELVDVINTLDYDAMSAQAREDIRDKLSADTLKTGWGPLLNDAGAFKEVKSVTTFGQKDTSTGEDYAVAILTCAYENKTLVYTFVLDKDYQFVGMYLK